MKLTALLTFTLNKKVYVSSTYWAPQKGFEIRVWTQGESLLNSKSKGHNIYCLSSPENILNARLLENQLEIGGCWISVWQQHIQNGNSQPLPHNVKVAPKKYWQGGVQISAGWFLPTQWHEF